MPIPRSGRRRCRPVTSPVDRCHERSKPSPMTRTVLIPDDGRIVAYRAMPDVAFAADSPLPLATRTTKGLCPSAEVSLFTTDLALGVTPWRSASESQDFTSTGEPHTSRSAPRPLPRPSGSDLTV